MPRLRQNHQQEIQHDLVNLAHFRTGIAKGDGAGHIRTVAAELCAKIEGDHIALFDFEVAGHCVGQRTVGAGGCAITNLITVKILV